MGVNPSAWLTETNPPICYQEAQPYQREPEAQHRESQVQRPQAGDYVNLNKRQVELDRSHSESESMSVEGTPKKPIVIDDSSRKRARNGSSGLSRKAPGY